MKSPFQLSMLSQPALTAVLALLFAVPAANAQSGLAPVVDAADSEAWVDAYTANSEATSESGEPSTDLAEATGGGNANGCNEDGCHGSGCNANGCDDHGRGPGDCNYGVPLWRGSCQSCGGPCGGGPLCQDCRPSEMTPVYGGLLSGDGMMRSGCGGGGNSLLGQAPGMGLASLFGGGCSSGNCSGNGDGGCSRSCNQMPGLACPCGAGNGARSKRIDVFKEFLYLQSRNAEVAYAVPVDGPITPTQGNGIQIGRTALAEMNYEPGFRIGANFYGQNCNGLMLQWAHFESHNDDQINTSAPDVIRSLVTHPLGTNAASDGLLATSDYDLDFDLVDLAFRFPYRKCNNWCAEVLWGLRYGSLNQEFFSAIDFNGETTVTTDIDFVGLGPQVGLSAQRRFGCSCLYAYSQGLASFLVGKFDGQYQQSDAFGGVVVDTSWNSGRIVPLLEYELGVGLMSPGGRARLRVGYMVNAWFNAVRTDEFINAVQANNPDGLGSGISFDGLTIRSEFRF